MKFYSLFISLILSLFLVLNITTEDSDVDTAQAPVDMQGFENLEIALYPNPVYDVANIKSNREISRVVILNAKGKVSKSISFPQSKKEMKIDVSELVRGMYFIRFYDEESKLLRTYKLLKYKNVS